MEAQEKLRDSNIDSRVISVPCYNLFDKQNQSYKNEVLGKDKLELNNILILEFDNNGILASKKFTIKNK